MPMNKIVDLKIEDINFDFEARYDLSDLKHHIKTHGQLTPVWVKALDGGKYGVLAGRMRCIASRDLGLTVVKCVIITEAEIEYFRMNV